MINDHVGSNDFGTRPSLDQACAPGQRQKDEVGSSRGTVAPLHECPCGSRLDICKSSGGPQATLVQTRVQEVPWLVLLFASAGGNVLRLNPGIAIRPRNQELTVGGPKEDVLGVSPPLSNFLTALASVWSVQSKENDLATAFAKEDPKPAGVLNKNSTAVRFETDSSRVRGTEIPKLMVQVEPQLNAKVPFDSAGAEPQERARS